MIDTSIIRQGNIFIRIFSQKTAIKSILFGKDADKKIRRIILKETTKGRSNKKANCLLFAFLFDLLLVLPN